MTNHLFTLAYNLTSEVEKTTKLLYEQNQKEPFHHLIIDLGFPLVTDEIPASIEGAKEINTKALQELAKKYGSEYVKMPNIGVSQNWTQAYEYLKPADDDVIIPYDPDEHPVKEGWVKAMADVIRESGLGMVVLMMTIQLEMVSRFPHREKWHAGTRVLHLPDGSLNFALLAMSGKFMNTIKVVPAPEDYPLYGGIEWILYDLMRKHNFAWGLLPDYQVEHTDYEVGTPGTSKLLREWKNQIVWKRLQYGQIKFEEWLQMRKEGRL